MTAGVRLSVVGRQLSRCQLSCSAFRPLTSAMSCRRHWPLLRFNVRGNEIESTGLIAYYLVYAIGVRIRIARHEKWRRN
jgi:hypothetical protein